MCNRYWCAQTHIHSVYWISKSMFVEWNSNVPFNVSENRKIHAVFVFCKNFAYDSIKLNLVVERWRERDRQLVFSMHSIRLCWISVDKSNGFIIELATKYLNTSAICINMVMILILNVYLSAIHGKPEFSNRAKWFQFIFHSFNINYGLCTMHFKFSTFFHHKMFDPNRFVQTV